MRTFLLFILLLTGTITVAQTRCATTEYILQLPASEQQAINAANAMAGEKGQATRATGEQVFTIPVIVHMLYNNASQNISDAQIKSGIAALNRDFRRLNFDTANTPLHFRKIAADARIEFVLATADPMGRATDGIIRKQTNRGGWASDDKIKFSSLGGSDAWPAGSYLNIWIGNLVGGAGFATVPGTEANKDGVVISYTAFGTQNTAAPFNLGRTAVHEVGHWLGLKHIWGDAACGDDGIGDTPQQSWYTQGCPTGFRSSCNNGAAGDMYMNFMDYTNDACMNLFTEGQAQKMRSVLAAGGSRASLQASKGLLQPWLEESAVEMNVSAAVYPNPATNKLVVQLGEYSDAKWLILCNAHGQVIKNIQVTNTQVPVNISSLASGIYFIKGEGFTRKFVKL